VIEGTQLCSVDAYETAQIWPISVPYSKCQTHWLIWVLSQEKVNIWNGWMRKI